MLYVYRDWQVELVRLVAAPQPGLARQHGQIAIYRPQALLKPRW